MGGAQHRPTEGEVRFDRPQGLQEDEEVDSLEKAARDTSNIIFFPIT